METTTDTEQLRLIEGLKKKDETVLKEVMQMYKNRVFKYLHLMLRNKEKAEDLTQETFVTVYFKAGSIRTANLKSWIFRIATNHAISELRREKIKRFFSLDDPDTEQPTVKPNPGQDLELEQMLALIPEKSRIPVIMKQIDNFSFEEIAEIMDKPISTIKTLVYRGLEQLKINLAPLQSGGIHE